MVDCSLSYNAIIGRPTLNSWKAVTSTYHLSIKFPTEYGVGQVQGDQLATRECYLVVLAMDEQVQTMSIEERRDAVEPTETLENISLDEDVERVHHPHDDAIVITLLIVDYTN